MRGRRWAARWPARSAGKRTARTSPALRSSTTPCTTSALTPSELVLRTDQRHAHRQCEGEAAHGLRRVETARPGGTASGPRSGIRGPLSTSQMSDLQDLSPRGAGLPHRGRGEIEASARRRATRWQLTAHGRVVDASSVAQLELGGRASPSAVPKPSARRIAQVATTPLGRACVRLPAVGRERFLQPSR